MLQSSVEELLLGMSQAIRENLREEETFISTM